MAAFHTVVGPGGAWLLAVLCALAASSCGSPQLGVQPDYVGPEIGGPKEAVQPEAAPKPVEPAPAPEEAKPPPEPISVGLTEAVLTALANNQALVVEKLNTPIIRTFEEQERAAFDPDLTAGYSYQNERTRSSGDPDFARTAGHNLQVDATQFLPTGTTVDVGASTELQGNTLTGSSFYASRVGLTVTQALLRGYGMDVNLASLGQARLDTLSSQYELRGFAQDLVARAEETYWDYALAQREIQIFEDSLKLAGQQLTETNERIAVGVLADLDRAASEAEVASRREDLITARSTLDRTRLQFLRLLNPAKPDYWARDVTIETPPVAPAVTLENVGDHVQVALRLRPDLNQARLLVERNDLELVRTKNGLLPRMDLFVTLGKTGYANSFGGSWGNLGDKGYELLVGVNVEYPPLNRDARARHQRAMLSRRQAFEAVDNVAQLVEVDVRTAYILFNEAREQVAATAATRHFQEEKVRAEMEKFHVGKSTTLLVAQAQRDLLQSQIAEVEAVIASLKSLVEFYRLDGSLLARRGIACPGAEPVEMSRAMRP